jgi:hypothetical protein
MGNRLEDKGKGAKPGKTRVWLAGIPAGMRRWILLINWMKR